MAKTTILHNKYVLYVLVFLAATNILGYLALRDFEAVTLFVVLGLIASYFSKNMIVILSAAILGAAIFRGMGSRALREGLAGKRKSLKKKKKKRRPRRREAFRELAEDDGEDEEKDEEEGGARSATESEEDASLGKRIDYAGTMEQAYNNLQDILGDDGINNLTKETQTLMKQQTDLMKQLEGLAPIMENAKEVMKTLESSGMGKMMEKFIPQAQALMQKK